MYILEFNECKICNIMKYFIKSLMKNVEMGLKLAQVGWQETHFLSLPYANYTDNKEYFLSYLTVIALYEIEWQY